jgi:hypothetical protein
MTIHDNNLIYVNAYGVDVLNKVLTDNTNKLKTDRGYNGHAVIAFNFINQDDSFAEFVAFFNSIGVGVCPYYYEPPIDHAIYRYGLANKDTPNFVYLTINSQLVFTVGVHELIHIIKIINFHLYELLHNYVSKSSLFIDFYNNDTNKASLIDSDYDKNLWSDELLADFFIKYELAKDVMKQVLYNILHNQNLKNKLISQEQFDLCDFFVDTLSKLKDEKFNPFVKKPSNVLSLAQVSVLLFNNPLSVKVICKNCTHHFNLPFSSDKNAPSSCPSCNSVFCDATLFSLSEIINVIALLNKDSHV